MGVGDDVPLLPLKRRTPGGSDVVIKFERDAGSSTGTRTPE